MSITTVAIRDDFFTRAVCAEHSDRAITAWLRFDLCLLAPRALYAWGDNPAPLPDGCRYQVAGGGVVDDQVLQVRASAADSRDRRTPPNDGQKMGPPTAGNA